MKPGQCSIGLIALAFGVLVASSTWGQGTRPFIRLEKDKAPITWGDIEPGSEAAKRFDTFSTIKWQEATALYIALTPDKTNSVMPVDAGVSPMVIRWTSEEAVKKTLLAKARGQGRWLDGTSFLMGSDIHVLDAFLQASGVQVDPAVWQRTIKGAGMTYVVPKAHLNAEQQMMCLHSRDDADTILRKLRQRKPLRKQAAYNLWELMGFPLDTPMRFYLCQSGKDVSYLLHDSLRSWVPFNQDKVGKKLERQLKAIKAEDIQLAIRCFYLALNKSDKEIKALLKRTGSTLTKLPKDASDESIRQGMSDLFVSRVMFSPNQMQAGMDLAGEIAKVIKGDLLDAMTEEMTRQVSLTFNDITVKDTDEEKARKREAGRLLFDATHAAIIGYVLDDTGVMQWFGKRLGHLFDDRAYVLKEIFSAAKDGLEE